MFAGSHFRTQTAPAYNAADWGVRIKKEKHTLKIRFIDSIFRISPITCILLGILSGCDSETANNEANVESTLLIGLWENRSTAAISDGVLSDTVILESNREWFYISETDGEEISFQKFAFSEADNCLQNVQSVNLIRDVAGRYLNSIDEIFFANISVTPSNSVLLFSSATGLTLARERIDVSFMQLQTCES